MANSRKYPDNLKGNLNAIGEKIQKVRLEQNISKEELSHKLLLLGIDISEKSLYHIESGKRTIVDFELCAISVILNTPVQYFLDDYRNSLKS